MTVVAFVKRNQVEEFYSAIFKETPIVGDFVFTFGEPDCMYEVLERRWIVEDREAQGLVLVVKELPFVNKGSR